jgi:hypothetical protein
MATELEAKLTLSAPISSVCAIVEPVSGSRFGSSGAAESREQSALTHPSPAALNQNHQHNRKKHAGNNPDN